MKTIKKPLSPVLFRLISIKNKDFLCVF